MAKLKDAKRDLEKWKIKQGDSFSKRITKACKLASENLQKTINRNVDRPTNFTRNAVGFQFKVDKFGTKNRIFIKDLQAQYLAPLIDSNNLVSKFVPNRPADTNQFGNIAGLKQMRNLKAVKQKHKGIQRTVLIKTNAKKNKRLIAIFKRARRRHIIGTWDTLSKTMIRQINSAVKISYQ